MSPKPVIVQKNEHMVTLTLNRPDVMNAMSREVIEGLWDALEKIAADESIRVVILRGAGDHFCSGADIHLFSENVPPDEWVVAMKGVGRIVKTLRAIPPPVIAMLKGVAVGGGANLALAADFVVAAENTRFCEIFINIGAILDYGGHYFLPRLVGLARARELAMLGDEIDGKTAASMGLIYKAVPEDQLEAEVESLANTLSQKPPLALRLIKEGLENSFDMTLQQVLDWEAAHQSIALQTPQHKEIVELFLAAKKEK
ncbi:MAG: enoyl-CoA hydratase/isomerase family protein [Deltaproteobacteria bacterium]|jgi:enoyl-CoA hydratase/carnithine racemase|nr:enoyl-CoA hydratase/isomerase family protein [Deltaproteobacteria bacterium]MBW2481365.1 enoyl-CoA hydratase/isomerase family protein [Deltaproteobacteria bacterium]